MGTNRSTVQSLMVESGLGEWGEEVSGHATHRQMVLEAYRHTHTVSLLSLSQTHVHTPLRQNAQQSNKQARNTRLCKSL